MLYFFTLTLQPKYYKYKPEEQYDMTYMSIFQTIWALGSNIAIIAELTKNYNIHYHGLIDSEGYSNLVKYFRDAFRNHKYVGYISIEQVVNEPKCKEYIIKDLMHTKEQISRPPIIVDELNLVVAALDGLKQDLHDEQ